MLGERRIPNPYFRPDSSCKVTLSEFQNFSGYAYIKACDENIRRTLVFPILLSAYVRADSDLLVRCDVPDLGLTVLHEPILRFRIANALPSLFEVEILPVPAVSSNEVIGIIIAKLVEYVVCKVLNAMFARFLCGPVHCD